jgi:hypothetical protein
METKLRQLAALMASRHLFAPEPDREEGVRLVRERWARLRKALGGRRQPTAGTLNATDSDKPVRNGRSEKIDGH